MKNKLFIGITTSTRTMSGNVLTKQEIIFISNAFLELFKNFDNVIPIILSSDTNPEHVKDLCETLDGLILSSGEDVHPSFYNTPSLVKYDEQIKDHGSLYHRPKGQEPNKKRDRFEIQLYNAAKEKNIPILGICRGMQLINIAEGGTLHQELPVSSISHYVENDGWIHYHNVEVNKDSKTFSILNTENCAVSSIHHQGVNQLGEKLIAAAKADDGIVEIIEHSEKDFIIGVQGHIEKILNNFPVYKKLIESFVDSAYARKNNVELRLH